MSDLITRKNAVSWISDLLMLELRGERLPTWNEVYNAIMDVPSAQAWIPLKSGRLPKQGEIVLVTVEGWFEGEMFERGIDLAWLVKEGGYIDGFDTVNDWIEYGEWRVTAWMPIEPYREDCDNG